MIVARSFPIALVLLTVPIDGATSQTRTVAGLARLSGTVVVDGTGEPLRGAGSQ